MRKKHSCDRREECKCQGCDDARQIEQGFSPEYIVNAAPDGWAEQHEEAS